MHIKRRVDRGDGQLEGPSQAGVVVAGHGYVFWNLQACCLALQNDTGSDEIVAANDGRGPDASRHQCLISQPTCTGEVGVALSEPRRTWLLDSAVIYMRGETPFGPAYVGLGRSSSGPINAYFFIGTH